MHALYERDLRALPTGYTVPLGRVWHKALGGEDRERAFAAGEVATPLGLRHALRNGTVWTEHSLAFRSRETSFIPQRQWEESRRAHYRQRRPQRGQVPLRRTRVPSGCRCCTVTTPA